MAKKPKNSLQGWADIIVKGDRDEEIDKPEPKDDITLAEFIQTMHEPNYSAAESTLGLPSREWLKEQFSTKSAAIRYLVNQGFEVKDIAKHLNMRYQHVRNVSKTELKRGPNEDWRKPLLQNSSIPTAKDFKPVED